MEDDKVATQTDVTVTLVGEVATTGIHTPKGTFSLLSAFGLAFSVINSWVVLVVGLGSGLTSGGSSACEYESCLG